MKGIRAVRSGAVQYVAKDASVSMGGSYVGESTPRLAGSPVCVDA